MRTPQRPSATGVMVPPLTAQVEGVQPSLNEGARLLELPVAIVNAIVYDAPKGAVASAANAIDCGPTRADFGWRRSVVVASANWPELLLPQQRTSPANVIAQVCASPAVSA